MRRLDPEIERILNSEPVQIGIPILVEVVCAVITMAGAMAWVIIYATRVPV